MLENLEKIGTDEEEVEIVEVEDEDTSDVNLFSMWNATGTHRISFNSKTAQINAMIEQKNEQ